MSDLENLRPEVREALDEMDRIARIIPAQCSDELRIIHAELLRFARENDEWQTRCLRFQTERDMARAELAALKARIADSRTTDVFESEGHAGMVAMGGLPCEWIGHRVALVKVED